MNAIENCGADPATKAMLTAGATDLLSRALALQGAEALACTRLHAAYHEAGHAAVSAVLGLRVYSVAVFRRGHVWLGFTDSGAAWLVSPTTDPQADLLRARVLLAGPLAEQFFSGRPALGAGVDEIATAQAIVGSASYKLGTTPEALMMRTTMEVLEILGSNRPTLDALAEALLRKPKIKQIELARLLRPCSERVLKADEAT